MTLEWTVDFVADFPDDVINRLCDMVRQDGYDEKTLCHEIMNEICGWDDDVYYQWGTEQTKEVLDEVKRRVGGVQLSVFD